MGVGGGLGNGGVVGQGGGDAFGTRRVSAVQENHVRMRGMDVIELVPDQAVIIEVEAAGEGDLRPGRQHDFGVSPAPGGEEVAAVDDGGSQGAMVDLRAAARVPVRSGLAAELVGGLVWEEIH